MALWGSKKENVESSEQAMPVPAMTPEVIAEIVSQAVARAMGQNLASQSSQSDDQSAEDRQEQRIRQLETTITNMTPYARAIESGIPSTVREQVVTTLSEGEREIYHKYQHEVDAYMKDVSIEARSNPLTHRKAISLVLGEHVREVAELTLQRANADDVPHLAIPSLSVPSAPSEPELTSTEREYVNGYAAYDRNETWNPTTYKYYQNIPRGYLHDMVKHHKDQLALRAKKE
jgi:hypothetical protein